MKTFKAILDMFILSMNSSREKHQSKVSILIMIPMTLIWLLSISGCSKEKMIENQAPAVMDQSFTIEEHSPVGTVVGTIVASDPEADTLTFSLNSAEVNAMEINESSGMLTVFNKEALDYEATSAFTFDVEVSDGERTTTSIVTINLTDIPEFALQFDGVDGQVVIPDATELSPSDEITIAMWVRLEEAINCDTNDNQRSLINKGAPNELGSGYSVSINCDGALSWSFGTENGKSLYGTGEGLQVDQWTFLTFVYDGTSEGTTIYMNGIKNLSGEFDPDQVGSGFLVRSRDELHINELSSSLQPYLVNFPGSIDELSLWDVALNASEIENIYFDGIQDSEPGLVGHWSCNSGSGSKVLDQASGYNGTLTGGVNWIAHQ